MHILFVHQNYPAQFGHIARYLVKRHGFRCSFLSNKPAGLVDGIQRYQYTPLGGASKTTHYCVRTFENAVAHAHGVHAACRQFPGLKPDLIVGHSGFGSTLFLRELFDCPILNYFEYFYHPHDSDLDYRPEFLPREIDFLRSYCRNAMILLDLNNCARGYSPTAWQRSLFPSEYLDKIEVIFDGVDRAVWSRVENPQRVVAGETIPDGVKIVTYAARGFEAMRGFDIFMKAAKRIAERDPNVLFLVVGSDRVSYGGDLKYIQEKSFREHVLKQDNYDLSRFRFIGTVPPPELARIFSLSDAHIYLTVPFVLSWSLFDALACGATVIASDTPPVRELIEHNRTGLLAPFFDAEAIAEATLGVLRDPQGHRHLSRAGMELIEERYTLDRCLPRLLDLYQRVARTGRAGHAESIRS